MGSSNELLNCITEAILEKKGKEIVNIDLMRVGFAMCDNFIICHGDSTTQVGTIAEWVEEKVKTSLGVRVIHREGVENAQWILLDYGSVVVHVFMKAARDYYKLEDLWGDADIIMINEK